MTLKANFCYCFITVCSHHDVYVCESAVDAENVVWPLVLSSHLIWVPGMGLKSPLSHVDSPCSLVVQADLKFPVILLPQPLELRLYACTTTLILETSF